MRAALLVATLLALSPAQAAQEAKKASRAPRSLESVVAALQPIDSVQGRVLAASELLVGVRYRFDPLGEGSGHPPDTDPLSRADAFDCQTFVETVMAIANSTRAASLVPTLSAIRYEGEPSFAGRNHFFEAQWVVQNEKKGFLREITAAIAGDLLVPHRKVVTPEAWRRMAEPRFAALPDDRTPAGDSRADYLPLAQVVARSDVIPSGAVFALVRQDRPDRAHMVTHMGFVIRGRDGPIVRHASSDGPRRVVDEKLARFVARNARLTDWKVVGMRFFEVLDARATGALPGTFAPR